MIEQSLDDIRRHIESLATVEGSYYLACARHGDRPVPADGLRFEDRATARAAARATELYRARLRRYDKRLPRYDIVVCQEAVADRSTTTPREYDGWTLSNRIVASSVDTHQARIRFCHRVAAAVFEGLTERECDAAVRAVLSAYYDLAEVTTDPDSLCVQLLEQMAVVLDEQLPPEEQAGVVTDAADWFSETALSTQPIATTLSVLEEHGLLDGYTVTAVDPADDPQRCHARLSGYRLTPQNECLPILPLVLELARHRQAGYLPSLRVAESADGWELTFGPATAPPRATVPINAEV